MQLIEPQQRRSALLKRIAILGLILLAATGGAAAQTDDTQTTNPICDSNNELSTFQPLMNGVLQLSVFLGVSGAVVSYFGTTAVESLPVGAEKRESMKQLQSRAFGAALKLLFGGAAMSFVLSQVFDISCLNLVPI
jgi:hypothetical protein